MLKSLKSKMAALMICGVIMVTISVSVVVYLNMRSFMKKESQKAISEVLWEPISVVVKDHIEAASLGLTMLLSDERVVEAFARGDRGYLARRLVKLYREVLKPKFGIKQFQFHLPPARSFLRVHKPNKYGDDLSGFRKTVLAANRERRVIEGIEVGRAGLGIRVVYPVEYMGRHIGSVEFGMDYAQAVESVVELYRGRGASFAIGIKEGVLRGIAFKEELKEKVGDVVLVYRDKGFGYDVRELEGRDIVFIARSGKKIALAKYPIRDFSNSEVGYLYLSLDVTSFAKEALSLTLKAAFTVLIMSFLAVFFIVLVLNWLLKPLDHLVEMLREISEGRGDLTKRIDIKREDEIGKVAMYFNRFIDSLRDMINSVKRQVEINASAAAQLSSAADEISSTTDTYTATVNKVSDTTSDMVENNRDVLNNIESLIQKGDEVLNEANATRQTLSDTIGRMNDIKDKADSLYGIVEKLQKMSERIGDILTVINDIADRTNLLALNAAIEAARAGEHGRGFAVVADEVRKLAESTQKATDEIFEMITSIQGETQKAFDEMRETKDIIEVGVESAEKTQKVFEKLVSLIQEIKDMNAHISDVIKRETEMISSMVNEMCMVNEGCREIKMAIEDIDKTAAQLHRSAEEIKELVDKFKT